MDKETSNPERLVSQPEPANGQQRPCYFLSVEVENVRSFKESQTLRLSNSRGQPAKWTILIGDNGVGKTTLLQVLASFQSAKLGVHVSSEQTKTILVPRMFSDLPRSLTLFLRAGAESLRCKANIAFGQKLTEPERASQRLEFEVRIEANFKAPQRGVFSGAFPPDVNAFVCYGYGSGRRMSERALAESRHDDTCKTLFEEGEPLLNAEEWLLQADYAAIKTASPGARDKRDQIIDILRRVLPDVPELRIQPGNASLVPAAVEAKTPYGWVPLRSLSSGYRSLVAWMVDLASRMFDAYPTSTNPLSEPAVVLVDQIDLFLHPKWQMKLVSYLANLFPNTQFITTAHSPLVVQAGEDTNIVVLRREDDHVIIDNDPARVRGWRIDQVLTSDIFGLTTTRDPKTEQLLAERRSLLAKPTLSDSDQRRLQQLDQEVARIPFVESPDDAKAMEILRRAADKLTRGVEPT